MLTLALPETQLPQIQGQTTIYSIYFAPLTKTPNKQVV